MQKGGETNFPRAKGFPQPEDVHSCKDGLAIRPEIGTVVLWYSLRPNGNSDPKLGALEVSQGTEEQFAFWMSCGRRAEVVGKLLGVEQTAFV